MAEEIVPELIVEHSDKNPSYSYAKYYIKEGEKIIYAFDINQIYGCCGTAHLCNGSMYQERSYYTRKVKDQIFNFIKGLMNQYELRNLIYQDISRGIINSVLEDYTEVVYKYHNPNSMHEVEHRVFTLDLSDCEWTGVEDSDFEDYDDDDDY